MGKMMARIENGCVMNMEWHGDAAAEQEDLVSVGDRPVQIGDRYEEGAFFREGKKILTPLETAGAEAETIRRKNQHMENALKILLTGG